MNNDWPGTRHQRKNENEFQLDSYSLILVPATPTNNEFKILYFFMIRRLGQVLRRKVQNENINYNFNRFYRFLPPIVPT